MVYRITHGNEEEFIFADSPEQARVKSSFAADVPVVIEKSSVKEMKRNGWEE